MIRTLVQLAFVAGLLAVFMGGLRHPVNEPSETEATLFMVLVTYALIGLVVGAACFAFAPWFATATP